MLKNKRLVLKIPSKPAIAVILIIISVVVVSAIEMELENNKFFVGEDGKVGVGTTQPNSALDVQGGSIRVSNNIGTNGLAPFSTLLGGFSGIHTMDVFARSDIRANQLCLGGGDNMDALGDCRSTWPTAGNPNPPTCTVNMDQNCYVTSWTSSIADGIIRCSSGGYVRGIDEAIDGFGSPSGNWLVECCEMTVTCS